MKSCQTLRSMLAHPKDKIKLETRCKQCEKVYIGETGRKFGTYLTEHMKDTSTVQKCKFARAKSKTSETEVRPKKYVCFLLHLQKN